MKTKLGFVIVFLLMCETIWAWGDLGHSAVGDIAERNLTPKGKVFVQSILGVEPLAVAATWPDHVRSDVRFNPFSNYHFLEINKDSFEQMKDEDRQLQDSHTIVEHAEEVLLGTKLNKNQKMIFLKYFIHIVGDVHQPLHLGNIGDKGANLCDVRVGESKMNLHSVWDSKIIDLMFAEDSKKKEVYYPQLTAIILAEFKEPPTIKGTPLQWYDETRKLLPSVYPDKQPTLPANRTYCKLVDPDTHKTTNGKYDEKTLPTLDEAYIASAKSIIKKQIWLGGYRLAYLLNQMAEKFQSDPNNDLDEKTLLEGVLIKNKASSTPKPSSKSIHK